MISRHVKLSAISIAAVTGVTAVTAILVWIYQLNRAEQDIKQRILNRPKVVAQTVQLEGTLRSSNGSTLMTIQEVFAVRNDGSNVRSTIHFDQGNSVIVNSRHLSMSGDLIADVSFLSKTMTTMRVPNADKTRVLDQYDPRSKCGLRIGGYDSLGPPKGHRRILEFDTIGYSAVFPDRRVTRWLAPSLECSELARKEEFVRTDGSIVESLDLLASSVRLSEPDRQLFVLPQDFHRVSFSERFRLDMEAAHTSLSVRQWPSFAKEDDLYNHFTYNESATSSTK